MKQYESMEIFSEDTKTFIRMITSLTEETEAISLYEQMINTEKNSEAKRIIQNAQTEEMKHFCMDLEFLLRQKPNWSLIASHIIANEGDIVKNGENAEEHINRA